MDVFDQITLLFCTTFFLFGFIISLCNLCMKVNNHSRSVLLWYMLSASMYGTLSFVFLVRIVLAIVEHNAFK